MDDDKKKVQVILPIKTVAIGRDAADATGEPALLRVYTDKEPGVVPMWFLTLATMEEGRAKRALIPVVDIDPVLLAEHLMRLQAEYSAFVAAYKQERERPPEGGLPPLIVRRRK